MKNADMDTKNVNHNDHNLRTHVHKSLGFVIIASEETMVWVAVLDMKGHVMLRNKQVQNCCGL